MKIFFALIMLITCAVAPAQADEFEDRAIEMLELSNTIQPSLNLMDTMLEGMAPMMVQQMYSKVSCKGVSKEEVNGLVGEFRVRTVKRFGEELVPLMVNELRKHLTLEQVSALVDLMKTPAYQAYAEKTPEIMQTRQKAGEMLGQRIGLEVMNELMAENPKFQ